MKYKLWGLGVCFLFWFSAEAQQYNAEVINQKTEISVRGNKLTKDYYSAIKINNRNGEEFVTIAIPYSATSKIKKVNAHLLDKNGKLIKKLKKKDITEKSLISDFSLYEDNYIKIFTLKHNSYPYTLVYSYQIEENQFLQIANWGPVEDLTIPTKNASLQLTVPSDYKINYLNYLIDEPTVDSSESGKLTYKWHAEYNNFIESEELSPPIQNLTPRVRITPQEFFYEEKGSYANWNTYGHWQSKLIEDQNVLPKSEREKVLALTKDIDSKREKIRVLYHYLQDHTRYINVSIGTGGLKPYSAAFVSQNKYGDCKALTNYFKAMLDFLGIESYYTNIYAGKNVKKIDLDFPAQQFNHAILYIPMEDEEDIWLDLTSNTNAFNYLGTFTQNRDVLLVDSENSRLLRTPALQKKDVAETRKIDIVYNGDGGNTEVALHNTYRGYKYEVLKQIASGYNNYNLSKLLNKYIIPAGFNLNEYEIPDLDRDTTYAAFNYTAVSNGLFKKYGSDLIFNNVPFSLPKLEKPNDRKIPVQIDYPIYRTDSVSYTVPEGYHLGKTFDPISITNRFGSYHFEISQHDNQVTITKHLFVNAGQYPLSDYDQLYIFFQIVQSSEYKKFSLTNTYRNE